MSTEIRQAAQPLLDQGASACAEQLVQWARAHAQAYGVEFDRVQVRRWQSVEEPQSVELVVNLWVRGTSSAALRFWGAASTRLGQLVDAQPVPRPELLCADIHRQSTAGEGEKVMPSRSAKQQKLMGTDLARARAGKATKTGLSEAKLEEMAQKPTGGYRKKKAKS